MRSFKLILATIFVPFLSSCGGSDSPVDPIEGDYSSTCTKGELQLNDNGLGVQTYHNTTLSFQNGIYEYYSARYWDSDCSSTISGSEYAFISQYTVGNNVPNSNSIYNDWYELQYQILDDKNELLFTYFRTDNEKLTIVPASTIQQTGGDFGLGLQHDYRRL